MVRTNPIQQQSNKVAINAAAPRRTQAQAETGAGRGWLAGLCLTVALASGCHSGWSSDSCDSYLLCVSATSPLSFSEQLGLYGQDGSCWKSLDPEQCAKSCKAGLKALAATTSVKECHPSAAMTTDPGNNGDPTGYVFNWSFGPKNEFYNGAQQDPMLSGRDPLSGQWRCTRDDGNPNPSDSVRHMAEPNDSPDTAVNLPYPLPVDPVSVNLSSYEICPDQTASERPDADVYKFKVDSAMKVVAEIKYAVVSGDLDITLFKEFVDTKTGLESPLRIADDRTARDNACLEVPTLPPGTYYLVVHGGFHQAKPSQFDLNRYQIRVFGAVASNYNCP